MVQANVVFIAYLVHRVQVIRLLTSNSLNCLKELGLEVEEGLSVAYKEIVFSFWIEI